MKTIGEWMESRAAKRKKNKKQPDVPNHSTKQMESEKLSGELKRDSEIIAGLLADNQDFQRRQFRIFGKYDAELMAFANMSDTSIVNAEIMKPLMTFHPQAGEAGIGPDRLRDMILNDALYHANCSPDAKLGTVIESLLRGGTVILVEGMNEAIIVETTQVEKRAIDQPETEQVIRGAREGFIEQMGTNISLLRYRLPTPDFKVKTMKIGRITKSRAAICYLKGIVNDALVKEVERRLSFIDIDGVLDSGYLEQFIEDNHLSPFPQVQNTERVDKAVANMLEGRVVIMLDGSPFALIVPTVFSQFYQTTEDYNERYLMVSFIRLSRLLALAFSLITPSFYVAIISFNPELIPTEFAVAVAGGRAGVPFPSIIEVLIMEASMEVLREATLRLPQQIGGALSIVGVLVIGQAAVAAGFVSPITVVVIALTTIGSFATPAYNAALALRLLRFPLVFLAGMFGLYGVMVGLILIINHMLSLKSFGVPYMTPLVPGHFSGMKDTLFRFPLWSMKDRPALLHSPNKQRLGNDVNEMEHLKNNALDPLKAGNVKEDKADGKSQPDNGDPGRGGHH